MKQTDKATHKSLKLILILNAIFKVFVYFVFLWILVSGFSQISIPYLESSIRENVSENGGIGFSQLGIYLQTWKVFRNFGYWVTAIILTIEACVYFILAKNKPDLKASVKNQALRTFKYLLLLLFSYAIAGFAVDLVYVAYFLGKALQ